MLLPGGVQGLVGWSFEQLGLVGGCSWMIFKVPKHSVIMASELYRSSGEGLKMSDENEPAVFG